MWQQAEVINSWQLFILATLFTAEPRESSIIDLQIQILPVLSLLILATGKLKTGALKASLSSLLSWSPGSRFHEQL